MSHSTPPAAQTPIASGTMVPVDSNPQPGFGEARLLVLSPRLSA